MHNKEGQQKEDDWWKRAESYMKKYIQREWERKQEKNKQRWIEKGREMRGWEILESKTEKERGEEKGIYSSCEVRGAVS